MTEPAPDGRDLTTAPDPAPAPKRPPTVSKVALHPQRADIDADLLAGMGARRVAEKYGFQSPQTVFNYARKLRANGLGVTPSRMPITDRPMASQTVRDALALARTARRHLKGLLINGDPKAINGAISAATNALKVQGEALGELTRNPQVNISLSQSQQVAVGAHEQASRALAPDVSREAGRWLHAQVMAGEPEAVRIVRELAALIADPR